MPLQVPLQVPQVLVTLLLPDNHEVEHDSEIQSGGGLQCVQERTVFEPPLFSASGEVGAGETNCRVFALGPREWSRAGTQATLMELTLGVVIAQTHLFKGFEKRLGENVR